MQTKLDLWTKRALLFSCGDRVPMGYKPRLISCSYEGKQDWEEDLDRRYGSRTYCALFIEQQMITFERAIGRTDIFISSIHGDPSKRTKLFSMDYEVFFNGYSVCSMGNEVLILTGG